MVFLVMLSNETEKNINYEFFPNELRYLVRLHLKYLHANSSYVK